MFAENLVSPDHLPQTGGPPIHCPPAQLSWPGLPCLHAASPLLTSIHSGSTLLSNTLSTWKDLILDSSVAAKQILSQEILLGASGDRGNVLEGH